MWPYQRRFICSINSFEFVYECFCIFWFQSTAFNYFTFQFYARLIEHATTHTTHKMYSNLLKSIIFLKKKQHAKLVRNSFQCLFSWWIEQSNNQRQPHTNANENPNINLKLFTEKEINWIVHFFGEEKKYFHQI